MNQFIKKHLHNNIKRMAQTALCTVLTLAVTSASAENTESNDVCLDYPYLQILGASQIDVQKHYFNKEQCFDEQYINKLYRTLTKLYLEQGLIKPSFKIIVGRITNAEQKRFANKSLRAGKKKLVILVFEGFISEVTSNSKLINKSSLLPMSSRGLLNISDIDQAISQSDYLRSNKVDIDIYPNDDESVRVEFNTKSDGKFSYNVSVDNQGSESTGEWVGRGSVMVDSPFNLVDTLNVNASHTLSGIQDSQKETGSYARSLNVNYRVPAGYWSLSAGLALSQNQNQVTLPQTGQHQQQARSQQIIARLERTIDRSEKRVTNAYSEVQKFDTKSYFDGEEIEVQGLDFINARVGSNTTFMLDRSALMLDFWAEVSPGSHNASELKKVTNPKYLMFGLDATKTNYYVKPMSKAFDVQTEQNVYVRYSDDVLPAAKSFPLLAPSTVRGFSQQQLNATKAVAVSTNTFAIINKNKWQIKPYLGLDMGVSKNDTSRADMAAGLALGLQLNNISLTDSDLRMSIEHARGLVKKDAQKYKDDDTSIRMSYSF